MPFTLWANITLATESEYMAAVWLKKKNPRMSPEAKQRGVTTIAAQVVVCRRFLCVIGAGYAHFTVEKWSYVSHGGFP